MKIKHQLIDLAIFVGLAVSVLVGCTPSPAWVKAQADKVKVALVAPNAGYKFLSVDELSPSIAVIDYDGVRINRHWNLEVTHSGKAKAFKSCLDENTNKQRESVRPLREIATACSQQVGLPAPADETLLKNLDGLIVFMKVEADSMPSGNGIPLYQTVGNNLGGKVKINRADIEYKQASLDVDHCIKGAAEQGVIRSFSSEPPTNSGFGISRNSQSIEPFLDRFTDCLKNSGYSVSQ